MSEALAVYAPEVEQSITVSRPPEVVLAEAQKAAAALAKVISGKAKPVKFNGEVYLEFEDWQVVARFYGISVKVISTTPVNFGDVQGWEAKAEAIHASGHTVSAADSMCLNDEANWRNKPMFMLRSMAQTRACAKALRNVLAWVVVLAGYKPTPAEEMDGVRGFHDTKAQPAKKTAAKPVEPMSQIDTLKSKVWAKAHEASLSAGKIKEYSISALGKESSKDWNTDDCDAILLWIEDQTAAVAEVA